MDWQALSMRSRWPQNKFIDDESSIIFVHGLRGHPQNTWEDTKPGKGFVGNLTSWNQNIQTFVKSSLSEPAAEKVQDDTDSAKRRIYWPRDFLAKDFPQAKIWTFGYNADVVDKMFKPYGKYSISDHGRDLKVRLEHDLDNEVTLANIELLHESDFLMVTLKLGSYCLCGA